MNEFLTDMTTLHTNAVENMKLGPVTDAYGADLERVLYVLNQALGTEIVCLLRYKSHYFAAKGLNAQSAANEFLEHVIIIADSLDRIAERITQLGGEPDFNPNMLTSQSLSEEEDSLELEEMIKEDLIAEQIAVTSYTEVISWLGDGDPSTRRMLEEILAMEEEHAEVCLIS